MSDELPLPKSQPISPTGIASTASVGTPTIEPPGSDSFSQPTPRPQPEHPSVFAAPFFPIFTSHGTAEHLDGAHLDGRVPKPIAELNERISRLQDTVTEQGHAISRLQEATRSLIGAVCNLVGAVLSLFAAGAGAYLLFQAQPWTVGFGVAVCATLGCAFWTVAAAIAVREELQE
jgi:hypothetical protein